MKCVYCKNNTLKEEDGAQFSWCIKKADNLDVHEERTCEYFAPISNADHIRAMSDKELVEFVTSNTCPPEESPCEDECKSCWLEWLQQPYKEDEA